jgi:GNAT superfamily N-acetyltransferase
MRCVDNATALSAREERQLWDESGAYFIHDGEKLLGIGWLREKELLALASVVPGAGEVVLQTILSLALEETITLEVASTNEKAIRLYEKLGFIKTQILRSWYCVQ